MFDPQPSMDTASNLASDSYGLAQQVAGTGISGMLLAMAMPLFILLLFSYQKIRLSYQNLG